MANALYIDTEEKLRRLEGLLVVSQVAIANPEASLNEDCIYEALQAALETSHAIHQTIKEHHQQETEE